MRRRDITPDLEGFCALVHEHAEAVGERQTPCGGGAQQRSSGWILDHVDDHGGTWQRGEINGCAIRFVQDSNGRGAGVSPKVLSDDGPLDAKYAPIAIKSSSVRLTTTAFIRSVQTPFRVPAFMSYICRTR